MEKSDKPRVVFKRNRLSTAWWRKTCILEWLSNMQLRVAISRICSWILTERSLHVCVNICCWHEDKIKRAEHCNGISNSKVLKRWFFVVIFTFSYDFYMILASGNRILIPFWLLLGYLGALLAPRESQKTGKNDPRHPKDATGALRTLFTHPQGTIWDPKTHPKSKQIVKKSF